MAETNRANVRTGTGTGAGTGRCDKRFLQDCIADALFQLMEEQDFASITVSDIARRAGVSRMTYYRTFASKDDVVLFRLDNLFALYLARMRATPDLTTAKLAESFCECFYENREFIATLVNCEASTLILQRFTVYMETLYASILNARLHLVAGRYECVFFAGGLYMALIEWAKRGFADDRALVARTIASMCRKF